MRNIKSCQLLFVKKVQIDTYLINVEFEFRRCSECQTSNGMTVKDEVQSRKSLRSHVNKCLDVASSRIFSGHHSTSSPRLDLTQLELNKVWMARVEVTEMAPLGISRLSQYSCFLALIGGNFPCHPLIGQQTTFKKPSLEIYSYSKKVNEG